MGESRQVRFSDIPGTGQGGETNGQSADKFLNKEIVIAGVEQVEGNNGPMLLIHLQNGESFRTGSKVLLRQAAEKIKAITDTGGVVTTTIVIQKSKSTGRPYYSFQ